MVFLGPVVCKNPMFGFHKAVVNLLAAHALGKLKDVLPWQETQACDTVLYSREGSVEGRGWP